MSPLADGDWAYSTEHREIVRVMESRCLWGITTHQVWSPIREAVLTASAAALQPLDALPPDGAHRLRYIAAAGRVADAMAHDALLAPLDSSIVPLPHQIYALQRAVASSRVRFLLADEVGLGKTIEAALVMRELKFRGLVRRTLVVAPKGLVAQWGAEMKMHFNEEFRLLIPGELEAYRQFTGGENPWRRFDQVVCPMDSVKPIDGRRGWSREQVEQYNQERLGDLVGAGWDLIIVDEAHRVGGSSETVARYRLGEALAGAAPYLLLLSATPHQGKTDAFHRLIALLDTDAFPDAGSVDRERVQPYVIRTEKRAAIDADGKPLFRPRRTQLVPVVWQRGHVLQRELYDAVTQYARRGYNQAVRERRHAVGFLMLLMQRLVSSSTRAIAGALERRLDVLASEEQLPLHAETIPPADWEELDTQEQLDAVMASRTGALRSEADEVRTLLQLARRCGVAGPDAKAEALLDWLYRLRAEEDAPEFKALVFTEFVLTQQMLAEFLRDRGFSVVCLNGTMDLDERGRVQREFAGPTQILVSTDAGGEGLNLQFCHVVVNFDLPWSPMRIEQRIGRVDRIGQTHAVRALNFVLDDSVDHRVREVLETKLRIILEEFGVDKVGDVLDSVEAEHAFEDVFAGALTDPAVIGRRVDELLGLVRERAESGRTSADLFGGGPRLDSTIAKRVAEHLLPQWVERMTVSYLASAGGRAERDLLGWTLGWPDGHTIRGAVFRQSELDPTGATKLVTLEEPRVRAIAEHLPRHVRGQPVPVIAIPDLPADVRGAWSLWRVALSAEGERRVQVFPLFVHDDGRVLLPTARTIWNHLAGDTAVAERDRLEGEAAARAYEAGAAFAERHGRESFHELLQQHQSLLDREREKIRYATARRRDVINRIGLEAVRHRRLAELERQGAGQLTRLERQAQVVPELDAVLVVRVERGS